MFSVPEGNTLYYKLANELHTIHKLKLLNSYSKQKSQYSYLTFIC